MIRSVFLSAYLVSLCLITNSQQAVPPVKTIIVDAGHGGSDIGARGTETNEATITLAVAKKLAVALRETFPTIKTLETRPNYPLPGNHTNANAANRYRAEFANENHGELFISLHCNAAGRHPGGWYTKKVVGRTAKTRYVKKGKKR
ncbi:N-acetylmuramoyl-L-alanine amidase [Niabella ginsengisoli]|uniref:N-acetylmuramoyl-L-alanine amidase n=1 Tax=Niabella ginsengisoli TaxID=522298 RepID=A0ABS9SH42_9BACT|nr:N-acetylmuramoyl-L-alanine amidase [Niabella ginsengisoli]MCH5597683.1 N-acetylmuramoyl-L-alanine amidase [Niabella ginsengisoli]